MIRTLSLAALLVAMAASSSVAQDRRASLDANGNLNTLIAKHAAANNVPEALVRRVIKRESRGNPRAVSKGNYGLMQIRLATARSLGYRGDAAGLLDADTNMTYAVKYLAGAYRVAGGNHDRAVSYYASGYYYAAKRKGTTIETAASVDSFKRGSDSIDANGSAADRTPVAAAETAPTQPKLREARNANVSPSSPFYGGPLD